MAIKLREENITLEEMEMIEDQLIECVKNEKPIENIVCPRCGNQMVYDERGNSHIVTCETPSCVNYGIRGI